MPNALAPALTLALALASELAPASQPPELRLDPSIRPTRYQLELTVLPEETTFRGSGSIAIELAAPTDTIWLHAHRLHIETAWLERDGHHATARVLAGNEQVVGLAFDAPVPPGPARLQLSWWGPLPETETEGLFRQREGDDWYVFSQFEPIAARRAFPGFDEPGFKVPFQLSLRVPEGIEAVSNTRQVSETLEPTGHRLLTFAETPPLPTYLLALAVGPFDIADGGRIGRNQVPSRIVAPCGKAREAGLALRTTPELLRRLEDYFDLPYPYEKLDQVAIPETVGFGAMENPGLITWNMSGLLTRPEDLSPSRMRRLASVAAHELAHQWFGDYVTLAWWDDIWLNEGFATWMEDVVLEDWKPEWEIPSYRARVRGRAIGADALATARRVREPIDSTDDIRNAFDSITYAKGATLLASFERWLGPERFRAGVRRYLRAHAHGTATSADFLAALAAEGSASAPAAFSSFLDQAGAPLVTAELLCAAGAEPRVALSQRRFVPLGSSARQEQPWRIPICVRFSAAGRKGEACTLLEGESGSLELEASTCPDWVSANADGSGYYLVDWQGDMLARLLADGGRELTLAERVALLSDLSLLAKAGRIDLGSSLALVPSWADDPQRQVVESVAAIAGSVSKHMVPAAMRPIYTRFLRDSFGARARSLGLVSRPGEDEDQRLLRPRLIELVATTGEDPELRSEALRLARAWLDDRRAVELDMLGTVLEAAAKVGGAPLFERLLAEARSNPERRLRRLLIGALGAFPEPELQARALGLTLDARMDVRQTLPLLFAGSEEAAARERSWAFLAANFDTLAGRLPAISVAGLPRLAAVFCDREHRDRAQSFFSERSTRYPGGPRVLAQALESMDLCIAQKNAQADGVAAFLGEWDVASQRKAAAPLLRRPRSDAY